MPNRTPPQTERSKQTRFKKGQSGNPAGRARKLPNLDRLLLEVLGDDDEKESQAKLILEAVKIRAIAGDMRAVEILLDRGYGKQQVDKPIVVDNQLHITIGRE